MAANASCFDFMVVGTRLRVRLCCWERLDQLADVQRILNRFCILGAAKESFYLMQEH